MELFGGLKKDKKSMAIMVSKEMRYFFINCSMVFILFSCKAKVINNVYICTIMSDNITNC